MEAEPSSGASPSSLNFPFQHNDFGSFGDLFSQSATPNLPYHPHSHSPPPPSGNPVSPGQNFADLLAEFTLPGTALSPAAGDNSVGTTTDGPDQHSLGGGGQYSNAPSPQRQGGGGGGGGGDFSNEVNLQFQQFIATSLANNGVGGVQTPTSQSFTPQALYQPHQSSPATSHTHSLPGSHAPSPMPNYSASTSSNPIYQTQPLHQSPFVVVPNPYSVGPPQYSIPTQQAALFAQQFAMLQSQGQEQMANVLAQAQAIVNANQIAQQQHQQQQQQFSVGSQSTSADGEWRENEFVFSPLMSPAMTPGSVFTAASSLPPSTGPIPLSTPSDFFPPLTSPALGPQMYATDQQQPHQHLSHRNSLQGLVDGVGALSTQLPLPGSPNAFPYQSPRIHALDAGMNTAAGSGRRGASSTNKKARPSPLIKASDPALDPNRRKRRTTASNGNKSATTSPYIGATNPSRNGSTPGTTFSTGSSAGGTSQKTSPAEIGSGFDTPSPVDLAASNFSVTKHHNVSGVNLDGLPIPPPSFSSSQPYQLEPMGPPPPPSHSSSSVQHQQATPFVPQSQSQLSSSSSSSNSFNPITPATIMNFSSDFDISALSSLSPALAPTTDAATGGGGGGGGGGGTSSAFASVQNSPMLLPELDPCSLDAISVLPTLVTTMTNQQDGQNRSVSTTTSSGCSNQDEEMGNDRVATTTAATTSSSSVGKAKSSRKSASSIKASPALRAVDSKGKGKATEGGGGGGGGRKSTAANATRKEAKIAPSPRIAPSPKIRSSLSTDLGPEPHSKFAGLDAVGGGGGGDVGIAQTPENRKSTHKLAEQKRRDSLKLCFDELRKLLPPIMPFVDDGNRRPGEGNVGGQRNGEMDPENPNKGVSKVALLRRSNEYLEILRERIERRDRAITALRRQNEELKTKQRELGATPDERDEEGDEENGQDGGDGIPGLDLDLDLDNIDGGERAAGNLAFYEDLDFETKFAALPTARRASTSSSRRASVTSSATAKPTTRRSTRKSASANAEAMEVEG